ncbi:MAG: transglutaminase family protein [Rhodopseudomonas sp.]|uniref:transglutaminase-like domain-containing protein n=1 Tax=Rhodopseudomonas sp. TaxID=1078 RepID=UPI0017B4CBD5|nr:transglutaminase family protein [Rhodopseudomonas sp.]NVN86837.1 transglutaminase family protein [Rhodopseudomonas sp.]
MSTTACRPEYLQPSAYVDSDSAEVREFVARVLAGAEDRSPTEKAILLFNAVRDDIRYDPFHIGVTADEYRASRIAGQPSGFCIPKAILLTAALRAAGIPAAVGFADVRNHLNSPKLSELMETDLFLYHGYVALWLDGKMFKVTPAFNTELCQRFGVKELIFDGHSDALFHEFDAKDRRHMEYVNDRGWSADPPIGALLEDFRRAYPKLWQLNEERVRISDPAFEGPAK